MHDATAPAKFGSKHVTASICELFTLTVPTAFIGSFSPYAFTCK